MRRTLLPASLLLLLALPARAQEATYRVEEVEPAPPDRAATALSPDRLPEDLTGIVPPTDGAPFVLVPTKDVTLSSTDDVLALLDELLPSLGVSATSADLSLELDRHTLTPPDADALDQEMEAGIALFRRGLTRDLGTVSDATDAAIRDAAETTAARVSEARVVWRFAQLVDGVPCEGMGVVVSSNGRTLRAVTGALYADATPSNAEVLSADRAEILALAHVEATTAATLGDDETTLVVLPDGADLWLTWRISVDTPEGPFQLWVDAEDGTVRRVHALFRSASARGLAYDWSPTQGTATKSFEVDTAAGGNYTLRLAETVIVANRGADGTTGDLTLSDDGSGEADFDQAPWNDTTNVTSTTGASYNPWFQHVHAYAWAYDIRDWFELRGAEPLPTWTVTVNDADPCGYGLDNACGGKGFVNFGVGSTLGTTGVLLNGVLDATVVAHEMGHGLLAVQNEIGKGTVNGSLDEGQADYWSMSRTGQDTFGGAWAAGGGPVQNGYVPRQAEATDVFPDHLYLGGANNEFHANGQVIAWALWSARSELVARNPVGAYAADAYLMKALTQAAVGQSGAQTDKAIHDAWLGVLIQMVVAAGSSQDALDILAGFARAGLVASDKEAIVSISDDYLAPTDGPPSFTVWTGRDFDFDAFGGALATVAYNTHYEVEVSNDPDFTTVVSSGDRDDVTTATGVPSATWAMSAADWDTLKGGTELYYRVTTWDDAGSYENVRTSTHFYAEFFEMPANRAVINAAGTIEEDCACKSGCDTGAGRQGAAVAAVVLAAITAARRRR